MKDIALRLISELMQNSRRSDRDLAKVLKVSQPTITRIRSRLEKERMIQEYTMIPDFTKLGFELLAVTFFRFKKELSLEELKKVRSFANELQKRNPIAVLVAVNGMGLGFDRLLISFHENYPSYIKVLELIKKVPEVNVTDVDSFLVNLADGEQYQLLALSTIAKYLLTMKEKE